MSRDGQRAKVYDAEHELRSILERGGTIEHFGSTLNIPDERKFGDVASVEPYLRCVVSYAPVAVLPRAAAPFRVRERRGQKKAHYEYGGSTFAFPPYQPGVAGQQGWALRESVVLHELAHHLCGGELPDGGHGAAFTATYLYLLHHVIAPEAAHLLRVAYYERGVEIATEPAV